MKYYKLDAHALADELETDLHSGLSSSQVAERFKICGYNTRFSRPSFSFNNVNFLLLTLELLISVVYLVFAVFNLEFAHKYISYAIATFIIVLVSQVLIYAVKFFSDRAVYLSSLDDKRTLTVIRNGSAQEVKYSEITYGDIVHLKKGDYIPFDGILLSSNGLVTDETDICGNDRVSKHTGIISEDNIGPSQLFNTVFCGSYVVHGKASVVVTDVASRVYIIKSGKQRGNNGVVSSKTVDVATVFSMIFSLFCIIFTIICGLISNDYSGIITAVLLFSSIIVSGFMRFFADLIYNRIYLLLASKGVIIKSISGIEAINNSDVILVDYDMFFDNKPEITGLVTDTKEFVPISSLAKNNFSPILYAAFSLSPDSTVLDSCSKVLKKIGVDSNEINTMCPVFSRVGNSASSIELCARAYEGSNMIIACGNVNEICQISDCELPADTLLKLKKISTELLAVAYKIIDIIPNDLSSQKNGFTFAGVLGIKRDVSSDVSKKCAALKKNGVHPLVLFPGSESSVKSSVAGNAGIISAETLYSDSDFDIKDYSFVCDFDGDYKSLVSLLSQKGCVPTYFGDKTLRDKKCIAFKSSKTSAYDSKDADVIAPKSFDSFYDTFFESKRAVGLVNSIFECFCLFASFYVICGVLFSLLFGDLIITTVSASFILLIVLPFAFFVTIYSSGTQSDVLFRKIRSNEHGERSMSFVIVTSAIFLLICVATRFLCNAQVSSPFLLVTFITYLCAYVDEIFKKPMFFSFSLLLPVVYAVVLASPISYIFGYTSLAVVPALLSLLIGVAAKFIAKYICRSVKI